VNRDEILELARRAEVTIYAISTNTSNTTTRGDKLIAKLAKETSGRAFFPLNIGDVESRLRYDSERTSEPVRIVIPSSRFHPGRAVSAHSDLDAPRQSCFGSSSKTLHRLYELKLQQPSLNPEPIACVACIACHRFAKLQRAALAGDAGHLFLNIKLLKKEGRNELRGRRLTS